MGGRRQKHNNFVINDTDKSWMSVTRSARDTRLRTAACRNRNVVRFQLKQDVKKILDSVQGSQIVVYRVTFTCTLSLEALLCLICCFMSFMSFSKTKWKMYISSLWTAFQMGLNRNYRLELNWRNSREGVKGSIWVSFRMM